jgi:outer membrane protein assembly factor BamC
MLQRILIFAGLAQPHTEALLMAEAEAETEPAGMPTARLERQGAQTLLLVSKALTETWQRTGIVLDRIGFTVTERDQATHTYVVRYEDPDAPTEEEDKGFFSSLFGSDDDNFVQTYQIALSQIGRDLTRIQVLDADGKAVETRAANRILSLLQEQI